MIRLVVMTEEDVPEDSTRDEIVLYAATEQQESDVVAFIHDGYVDLIKNRFGPTGLLKSSESEWLRALR